MLGRRDSRITLLELLDGTFLSHLDPNSEYTAAARRQRSIHFDSIAFTMSLTTSKTASGREYKVSGEAAPRGRSSNG